MSYNTDTGQWEDEQAANNEASGFPPNVTQPDGGQWEDSAGSGTQYGKPIPAKKAYNPFDRNAFRDAWMANGSSYGGDVGKFFADQNLDPAQFQQSGNSGAYRLPTGEVIDMVMDKGGSNKAAWTGVGHMDTPTSGIRQYADQSAGQSSTTGNASSQSTSSTTASSAPTPEQIAMTQQREAMRKQLFDQLMTRSQQGLAVDRNDPTIRAQADAYSVNEERSKRNYLSDIAERSGPYATGNIRNEQRMANEGVGQRTGTFEAQLMGRELQAKRDEIAQALQSEQGLLSSQDQLALTEKLAQMDDTIKRLNLQQNASQFGQNLGLNYAQLAQQGNQFNQTLGSQNDQFLAQFGLNSTNQANYWDAVRSGLL